MGIFIKISLPGKDEDIIGRQIGHHDGFPTISYFADSKLCQFLARCRHFKAYVVICYFKGFFCIKQLPVCVVGVFDNYCLGLVILVVQVVGLCLDNSPMNTHDTTVYNDPVNPFALAPLFGIYMETQINCIGNISFLSRPDGLY